MSSRHSTRQTGRPAERRRAQEIVRGVGGSPMVVVVKEATMGWTSRLRAFGEVKPVDLWDETVISSASNGAHKAVRGNPENPAAPGDRPGAQITEEIKRRQTSLAVRYVAAVRARAR
jgi:hypothetical protein